MIKKAIQLATSNGYSYKGFEFAGANDGIETEGGKPTLNGWSVWTMPNKSSTTLSHYQLVLDPLFWQALGRGLEWSDVIYFLKCPCCGDTPGDEPRMFSWKYQMHRFIDHLADGKDADSFFAELINPVT